VGGCGGRGGIKKSDGGGDARDATADDRVDAEQDTVSPDGAPDLADGAIERGDATDAADMAEPEPICVNNVKEAPVCGKSRCGNGKRDTCLVTACSDGTVVSPTEACDGTDVGGETCAGSGYGSGTIACSSRCELDRGGCRACLALDPTLVACNEAHLPARMADTVRVAATDAAIALAWAGGEGGPGSFTPTLSLARLSPTLEVLGTTVLENTPPAPGEQATLRSVDVVPLGTGWAVVALADETRVLLHRVDAAGKDLGRVTLETLAGDDFTTKFVTLVSRPTGGAMAIWSVTAGMRAATIAADGTIGAPATYSLAGRVNVFPSNAVWLGDAAYLIHSVTYEATWQNATVLVRFGADGSAPGVVKTLFGEATGPRALAADADELLYSYGGADAMFLARFDTKGAGTAAPFPTTTQVEALIPAADDTFLISEETTRRELGVERRTRAGTVVGPRRGIVKVPADVAILGYSAARRGPETIVAWIGGVGLATNIGVARLAQ
jgi:hypothetical protein